MTDPHNAADAAVARLMGALFNQEDTTPGKDPLADMFRTLSLPTYRNPYAKETDA